MAPMETQASPLSSPAAAAEAGRDPAGESTVDRFKRTGYVVLEDLLPEALIAELRREYEAALEQKVRRFHLRRAQIETDGEGRVLNEFRPVGGNHDVNRWNMHLPSRAPFLDERLFAHPKILEVVDEVVGEDCVVYLMASDTPYPGSENQAFHQDFTRLSLALNVPLVDLTPDNAPIELWPGTHRPDVGGPPAGYSRKPYFIPADRMAEIVETVPSVCLLGKAGTMLLRDHRLVHRGTANLSDASRPQLSIYYVPPHAVPYRWVADAAAWTALAVRKVARGRGDQVQRPKLLNLGNLLGRVVEESSLSDRDYRRRIPEELWRGLSPRARRLLRFASVEGAKEEMRGAGGSPSGTFHLARTWTKSVNEVIASTLTHRPRRPDADGG